MGFRRVIVGSLLGLAAGVTIKQQPIQRHPVEQDGKEIVFSSADLEKLAKIEGLELENLDQAMLNTCSENPAFLQSLADLRKTIPRQIVNSMRKAFANTTGGVILSVNSFHMRCMFDNFLAMLSRSTKREGKLEVIAMNLDTEAQNFCQNRTKESNIYMQCLDISGWIEGRQPEEVAALAQGPIGADSCRYVKITWTKPAILYHAARMAKNGAFLIDADIIVHRNPFEWIRLEKDKKAELVMGDDHSPPRHIKNYRPNPNSGSTYVDQRSKRITREWCGQALNKALVASKTGEQNAVRELLSKKKKWKRMQMISLKHMGQKGVYGKFGTHFSGFTGGKKIAEMIKMNFWRPTIQECKIGFGHN